MASSTLVVPLLALCLLATLTDATARVTSHSAVTPIEKVIQLLTRVQTQLEEAGKNEAAIYDKFACFCKKELDNKVYDKEKSEKKIATLDDQVNLLSDEIAALNTDVARATQEEEDTKNRIASAKATRAQENDAYLVMAANVTECITAVESAIETLKTSTGQLTDAKLDFIQMQALASQVLTAVRTAPRVLPSTDQMNAVTVLAQFAQKPEVYEYQSNTIIGTLRELLQLLKEQKVDIDTEEFNAKADSDKKILGLEHQRQQQEKEKTEKAKLSAYKEELLHEATQEKDRETEDLNADNKFISVLKTQCEEKAVLWDSRSQTRTSELTAIAKALEILKTKVAPAWGANKKLNGLQTRTGANDKAAQTPPAAVSASAPVFMQLRGAAKGAELGHRVVRLLSERAASLGSSILTMAAARAEVSEDHFVKVRSLIKDLIARLESDADAEATEKDYCDNAMGEAIAVRDEAQQKVEEYTAENASLTAESTRLSEEIADCAASVADTSRALARLTEDRNAAKAANEATIALAEEGKAAVEMAAQILSDFYQGAAFYQRAVVPGRTKIAMVQQHNGYVPPDSDREGNTFSDKAPEVFQDDYHGDQESSQGILGLLEVIRADFERTIATVTSEEAAAETEFGTLSGDADALATAKEAQKTQAEADLDAVKDDLVDCANNLRDQNELLNTALSTLQKLEPRCVAREETYEERVARRQKEIEALKEAHAILENWQG